MSSGAWCVMTMDRPAVIYSSAWRNPKRSGACPPRPLALLRRRALRLDRRRPPVIHRSLAPRRLPAPRRRPGWPAPSPRRAAPARRATPPARRGRPEPAVRARSEAATSASAGASNSRRTGVSKWKAARIRAAARSASNECRPRSKKRSCRPTRGTARTSSQIAARRRSVAVAGGAQGAAAATGVSSGDGRRCRSSLPWAVSGSSASSTSAGGTM